MRPTIALPQLPDVNDPVALKEYLAAHQKILADKQKDDFTDSEEIKNSIPSVSGVASQAEAVAGTDNTKIITPLSLRQGLNANGSAPIYACRAWVNFNGTGTVAIRGSGNVSSITDNGTGQYTINFITPMEDTNYICLSNGNYTASYPSGYMFFEAIYGNLSARTVSSVGILSQSTTTAGDCLTGQVSIFR